MQEAFLHFIWQHQYFDKNELTTSDHSRVNIIHPGFYNTDAGPDFKEAKIYIGGIEWRGNVELHIRSSDWERHCHQEDEAYNNVILHVVWNHDREVRRKDNTNIPTLELKDLISEKTIFEYKSLLNSPNKIPCEMQLEGIREVTWVSTLDKVLMERLSRKAVLVMDLLKKNQNDWEETAYQLLARNFGFKINSEPFLNLAESTPYKILRKHADQPKQVEALLFGQAGFLEDTPTDQYQESLSEEYKFLQHKYHLHKKLSPFHWKLLRLRPANFPTVRIAQFAGAITTLPSLFKLMLEIESAKELKRVMRVAPSEYWENHYQFGKPTSHIVPPLGAVSIENIVINTVVPLLVAYGQYLDNNLYIEKGISMLSEIGSEKNHITNYWASLGVSVSTAFDSQALIHLYNEYCNKRRCLSCNIGSLLIRK